MFVDRNRTALRRQAPRAVRVFVSSTFRDFVDERDRLARFSFPAIRKLCEERGVVFTDVDLRWGIPDEQAAEGRVLPICLEEIDRSRPFFIGLLGEKYGWVPENIDPELIDREPWLAEHLERSVTELEIVHGVLNNSEIASRAFFYLRDPSAIESLPPERWIDYICEDDAAHRKLDDLKARIRASGLPVREGFCTPEELGELVVADLTAAISQVFPEDEIPDSLTRERLAHEAFAVELAEGFMERPTLSAILDDHAKGKGLPLLITGASGSGKSALLAAWSRHHGAAPAEVPSQARPWYVSLFGRRSHSAVDSEAAFIMHFCGASAGAADWASLCRRVASELERATGVEAEHSDDPDNLKTAFENLLFRAAAKHTFVLVLDGVDQIEDSDSAPDLSFLPFAPPPGCRLILSAVSGTRPADEAARRGWTVVDVGPLSPAEVPRVFASLIARKSRALSSEHLARICASPAASNPLFLSVLADELSVVGSYETLDAIIDRYAAVASLDDLYDHVLQRWESDYDARPGLVAASMRALWAARRGLSERELLCILSLEIPLPQASLAPLLLAAGRQIVSRSGLIGFAHRLLCDAVEHRYLVDKEAGRVAHSVLADYFETTEKTATRTTDELPWQLMQAREWEALTTLLVDIDFLEYAWDLNEYDVRRYWAALEANGIRADQAYASLVEFTPTHRLLNVSHLLSDLGHHSASEAIKSRLSEWFRVFGGPGDLPVSLHQRAEVFRDRGDSDTAMEVFKEEERISRKLGDQDVLAASLGSQGAILLRRGDPDEAMELFKEQERICRKLGDRRGLSTSLGNQGLILRERGDLDGAMTLHKEEERICRENGDTDGLSVSLHGQALVLFELGNLDKAMALFKNQELICREFGNRKGLVHSLHNQGVILCRCGDLEGAMALHKEEEQIWRELGDQVGVQNSLSAQMHTLLRGGDTDGALAALQQALAGDLPAGRMEDT